MRSGDVVSFQSRRKGHTHVLCGTVVVVPSCFGEDMVMDWVYRFLNRCVFNVILLRSRSYVPVRKLVERSLRGGRGMVLWLWWGGRVRTMETLYEVVGHLPGYRMTCFLKLSDDI